MKRLFIFIGSGASSLSFFLAATLVLIGCGEPGRSVREINPVLYMHRMESGFYAIRVNQVQRTDVSVHNPLDFRKKDDYYPIWFVLSDTAGTFRGEEIGLAISTLQHITHNDYTRREWIKIGGGSAYFKGSHISGKYKVVLRKSDPCDTDCNNVQLLSPVPP
jgi:hypothetical protein